jgi:hypothetical protein
MSKSTLKILPALMVAITAALVTHPAFGGSVTPPNTLLVLTEESSTVLDATVGGNPFGTVTLLSPDSWAWSNTDRPVIIGAGRGGGSPFWLEPGSLTLANLVGVFENGTIEPVGGLLITSDFDSTRFSAQVSDSTIQQNFFSFTYVGGSTETFDVQVIDKGDVATVPDTGTTFSLFGLSLTGLGFLRRKLC